MAEEFVLIKKSTYDRMKMELQNQNEKPTKTNEVEEEKKEETNPQTSHQQTTKQSNPETANDKNVNQKGHGLVYVSTKKRRIPPGNEKTKWLKF